MDDLGDPDAIIGKDLLAPGLLCHRVRVEEGRTTGDDRMAGGLIREHVPPGLLRSPRRSSGLSIRPRFRSAILRRPDDRVFSYLRGHAGLRNVRPQRGAPVLSAGEAFRGRATSRLEPPGARG